MLKIHRVPESDLPKSLFVAIVEYVDGNGEVHRSLPFGLSTYKRLSREEEKGAHIYHLTNLFFERMLSVEEQGILFKYYNHMHNMIGTIDPINLSMTRENMANVTGAVLDKLDIPNKLVRFIEELNPPIPDDTNAGSRDHDSQEMTFFRPDYIVLTAMSTLSKFMSPIWGQYINRLKPPLAEDLVKELFCSYLILPTLERSVFAATNTKLRNYLTKIVNNNIRQSGSQPSQITNNFVLSKNGLDMKRFLDILYAITLTKKLVIYNVWEAEKDDELPDIMKYVNVGIITTSQTKISLFRRQMQFLPRFDLTESSGGGSDNLTHNDHTARVSQTTVDIPVICCVSTNYEIIRMINRHGLSRKAFSDAVRYHQTESTLVTPNDLNQALTASLIGTRVGSSKAVRYNKRKTYVEAVIVTQMVLIKLGLSHLAHFLTCVTEPTRRGRPVDNINSISNTIDKSREWKDCLRRFNGQAKAQPSEFQARMNPGRRSDVESVNIQAQLRALTQWCVDYVHTYNTAPSIWAMIEDAAPVTDGVEIEIPTDITRMIAAFFLTVHPDISD